MGRRDERKRQKALIRKRQKDRLRKKKSLPLGLSPFSVRARVYQARNYPIHECLINSGWEDHGLADILVSREQPDGKIVFGVYLVDRYCLGLKNTFCDGNFLLSEYERLKAKWVSRFKTADQDVVECPVELAHQIIYGAIDYASNLGFKPHKDFDMSKYVLEAEDRYLKSDEIEFGRDGKPFYIAGPYDDTASIMRQLEARVGRRNFHYLIRLKEGEITSLPPSDLEDFEIEDED